MINLTKFVLKRPVTAVLCAISLIFFGLMSIFGMKLELTPDINMPMLVVTTTYPGASPEDIDKLIKRGDNIVARDDDLGVLAADVVGDFFSVLEVYRVRRHADGKGAYGLVALSSGNGTDE